MKSESLVIGNQNVSVNDYSNFAHTAHHCRRVRVSPSNTRSYIFYILVEIKCKNNKNHRIQRKSGNLGEVETR